MPVILSQVDPRSGHASTPHSRRERLRRNPVDRRRKLTAATLEWLEARSLLATIPTPIVTNTSQAYVGNAPNDVNSRVNVYDPRVAIDPTNSQHLVTIASLRDANPTTPFFGLQAQESFNGGATWTTVNTVRSQFGMQFEFQNTGATPPNPQVRYTRESYGSVAFDASGSFHVLQMQTNDGGTIGTVFLLTFAPGSNGTAGTARVVYGWNQTNLASGTTADQFPGVLDPTLAIDTNPASFTDPDTGAVQTNPGAGRFYIAWTKNTPPPANPPNPYNPFTIEVLSSTDKGASFGTPTRISGGNSGNQRYSSPRIAISNAATTATGQTIPGGQINVAYNDFGSGNTSSPPIDIIFTWAGRPGTGNAITQEHASTIAATTTIRGAATTGNYPLTGPASGQRGFGPGVSIAADNTLGSFSRFQGRLYMTYVDRYDSVRFGTLGSGNEADNTDVFLKYSDNGGRTWNDAQADPFTTLKNPLNQDDATVDGHSGGTNVTNTISNPALGRPTALRISGRPQFDPVVQVDSTTGTVVVAYLDARDDAARARTRYTVTTSIDGGISFSPDGYANQSLTAIDTVTGKSVIVSALPDNQSGGNSNANAYSDRGVTQALAVANGVAYPVWTGNENGLELNTIFMAKMNFTSGPRIIASTMGPVKAANDFGNRFNNTFASDGTQLFSGFSLTFDRPIDPASFPASAVTVTYTPADGSASKTIPVGSIVAANNNAANGPIVFVVNLATPQKGTGSYSYTVAPVIRDRIRNTTSTTQASGFVVTSTNTTDFNVPAGVGDTGGPTSPPILSPITISTAPVGEVVVGATVNLNINHTFDFDLSITLISPSGIRVPLALNRGGSGQNFTNTTFSDAAITAIAAGTAPFTGSFKPESPFSALNGSAANGTWQLEVQDGFATDVGVLLDWTLTLRTGTITTTVNPGNTMDQFVGTTNAAGQTDDFYATPMPLNRVVGQAPFDSLTAPIIVTGPYIAETNVAGNAPSGDNLVLNKTSSSIDVTFDRTMDPTTFTPADVNRIVGPLGLINGPTRYTAGPGYKSLGLGQTIPDNNPASPLVSTISIPSTGGTFLINNLAVQLSVTHPRVSDITATLVAPDGTQVPLFARVGGTGANIVNMVLDDTSNLPLSSGVAPYTNTYKPVYSPGSNTLSTLRGKVLEGVWRLVLSDSARNNVGSLVSWSLVATPRITVAPVPTFLYKSPNITTTIPVGATPTTTNVLLPIAANTAGTGGVPITIANLKIRSNITFNTARLNRLTVTLVGPDGTSAPITVDAQGGIHGNLTAFNGKALAGNWTLRVVNNTTTTSNPTVGRVDFFELVATATSAFGTPTAPQSFRISFPQQALNGSYNVQLTSDIQATNGDRIDSNKNAGLDILRGTTVPGGSTVPVSFPASAVPVTIEAGKTISSSLTINQAFPIQNAILALNIQYPNVPDLSATLTAPDGTIIRLFTNVGNVGAAGTRQNFTNTVFDDAATTRIQNGAAPFTGRFTPEASLLAGLQNKSSAGTYVLSITNNSATSTGVLMSWALTLTKGQPGSGLGEAVADQSSTAFRIFNLNPTDPISTSSWVEVGPQGILNNGTAPTGTGGADDRSSRIAGLAMDPSDPTGNTVFVGGASGGISKTTNFLTSDPKGPTYVELTDLGPNSSLNIGSIAVFGRSNDPSRSIVFAATGEGNTIGSSEGFGVGVLRSVDGGLNWDVLDSSTNVDSSGNILPINDPRRDHIFLGTSSFKVVVDPRPTPAGETIVYLAVRGSAQAAGIWRSLDTGKNWTRMRAGQATDVVLDPASGTVDAISNPTGNLRIVYGGFVGDGVYISPNQGQLWNQMAGGRGNPLIVDAAVSPPPAIPVDAPRGTPNGAKGRIVLAKPALTGNALQDAQYAGWLYAAVATPDNRLDGLYQTKDFGANWVRVRLPNFTGANNSSPIVPSNDINAPTDYDPTGGNGFGQANYDLALVVDPLNPNVVYLGGSKNGIPSGLIRVDSTAIQDSHAFYLAQTNNDGGNRYGFVNGPTVIKDPLNINGTAFDFSGRPIVFSPFDFPVLNFMRDPISPFASSPTLQTFDTQRFTNTGIGANYIPWDGLLVNSTDVHVAYSFVDPVSGKSRMVFGDDQGVFTGVDRGDGKYVTQLGSSDPSVSTSAGVNVTFGSRNGNLQQNQIYGGASQPTTGLTAQLNALFYFTTQDNGFPQSDPNLLTNGNLQYTGPGGDGAGVATDQTGTGTVYHYRWPCCGGNFTDFFTVDGVGQTFGLVQSNGDPQWPFAGGINFEVNPINGNQMVIGGATGNLYGTENQGRTWFLIADRSVLDGSQVLTMAYGAPDPTASGFTGALNNFIYAGTAGGRIYVTFTGGGSSAGNAWVDLSAGLDGSSVQKIVTNPDRATGEAYAVTSGGVYYMADSRVSGASWTRITGNLFTITQNPYGNAALQEQKALNLTSIQADYRYAIPFDFNDPTGPSHPLLYVGAASGVYRSFDNGTTWTLFPDIATNGSIVDGGYLPSVRVTDLDMVTGVVNPTTGRADGLNAPNLLLASTYGRGAFAIRLAPVVFTDSLQVSPVNGILPTGFQEVLTAVPTISGFSQQTAFGNTTNIKLIDLSNLTDLELTDNALIANAIATKVIGTGTTDAFGRFSLNVNAGSFSFNGVKRIGVLAIDGSGTQGNLAQIVFQLSDPALGPPLPPSSQPPAAPTNLALLPADNSGSLLDNSTNVTRPRITGLTDPNILVEIVDVNGNILATTSAAADGTFTIRQPTDLPNGISTVRIRARNSTGPGPVATIDITIDNTPDTPTIKLNPTQADDTGIVGDGVTKNTTPVFTGKTTAGVLVRIFNSAGTKIGETTSDVNTGIYFVQVTSPLGEGFQTISARAVAVINGVEFPSKGPDPTVTIRIDTTKPVGVTLSINSADLVGLRTPNVTNIRRPRFVGTTEPNAKVQIFRTRADGTAEALNAFTAASNGSFTFQLPFELTNGTGKLYAEVTDAQGNVQDVAVNPSPVLTYSIITVAGDYNRDGAADLANFRPSDAQFLYFSLGATNGVGLGNFGQPGRDIPIAADFDGDGKIDQAVFRRDTAEWFINRSTLGATSFQFGQGNSDEPIPGDYDGDGRIDRAVFRPSDSSFYISMSTKGNRIIRFGQGGVDRVLTGDFNGDGKTDFAVFRPTTDQFFVYTLNTDNPALDSTKAVNFVGKSGFTYFAGDIPVPGDYDGIGGTELALYRPSTNRFFVLNPLTDTIRTIVMPSGYTGNVRDVPVSQDYDGDGKTDAALYRPSNSTYYVLGSKTNTLVTKQFGAGNNDIAIPGRYGYRLSALRAPYVPPGGATGSSAGGAFFGASRLSNGSNTTFIPGAVQTGFGSAATIAKVSDLLSNGIAQNPGAVGKAAAKSAVKSSRTVKVGLAPAVKHQVNTLKKQSNKADSQDLALSSALESLGKLAAGRFRG